MKTFWKLMEKSTITSALLAVMIGGTTCYCVVTGIDVPDYFLMALSAIITFFFTSKMKDDQMVQSSSSS